MKTSLLVTIAIMAITQSVSSQTTNYNSFGKVKILAEKSEISLEGQSEYLKQTEEVAALAAAGAILPPIIDLVVKNVQQQVKKNALKYVGEYKSSTSNDTFYLGKHEASLPILSLKRFIVTKSGENLAVEIDFIPEISADKTCFRYSVRDKFIYNYSIAKTKGDYDYIDIDIEIKFKSLFVNKGEYKLHELRTTSIKIPMIKVGETKILSKELYSGWIPLPTRSNLRKQLPDSKKETKVIDKTLNDGTTEKTTEIITNTKSDSEDYSIITDETGPYEIELTIVETNPFKIKAENKKELIESSSESGTTILNEIVKLFTSEKEKEGEK